jgi:hypothetical protein
MPSFGMRFQEIMQDMLQHQHFLFIATDELGLPNVIDNHVPNFSFVIPLINRDPTQQCATDGTKHACLKLNKAHREPAVVHV